MRRLTDVLIALPIPLLVILYLTLAPYTKVEESFNIQATHDILTYGIPLTNVSAKLREQYDHHTFSGSVPRTFVGPLVLAGISCPFMWLIEGVDRQIFVRAILGLFNTFCILSFRNGVARAFGRSAANWYVLLQASQFHMMYYVSRPLSNFFAFGLTTLALRNLLSVSSATAKSPKPAGYEQALVFMTVVGVIFRSEIALLLGTHTLWLLLRRRISIQNTIISGSIGLVIGLGLTVSIDSFFWLHFPIWPELTSFLYNVMEGQSSNWGTSPFYYYVTSALPRLLNPLHYQVFIPLAVFLPALRSPALEILIPNLTYVFIYSFQPHKEWRFIIYIIPPLTAVAALASSWVWTRRTKSFAYRILSLALLAGAAASFLASFGMVLVSRLNYPGAQALNYLHGLAEGEKSVIKVHMDTLTCMTGVTHFLEQRVPVNNTRRTIWIYDKTENQTELLNPLFWDGFDYVLAERPEKVIGSWDIVRNIEGFAGLSLVSDDRPLPWSYYDLWGSFRVVELDLHNLSLMMERFVRVYVTRGWWVEAKMETKIRILKRGKEVHRLSAS